MLHSSRKGIYKMIPVVGFPESSDNWLHQVNCTISLLMATFCFVLSAGFYLLGTTPSDAKKRYLVSGLYFASSILFLLFGLYYAFIVFWFGTVFFIWYVLKFCWGDFLNGI